MAKIIKELGEISKKDKVNALNTTAVCKDIIGETINLVGAMTYQKDDVDEKTGEVHTVVATTLITQDGRAYSSISKTLADSLQNIEMFYTNEEIAQGIAVTLIGNTSKNDREFLTLMLA